MADCTTRTGRAQLWIVTIALVAVTVTVVPAADPPARAQDAPGVTLEASHRIISFGDSVQLSGEISPPGEGETISIVDHEGRERAATATDVDGRFTVRLTPPRTATFQARWVAALSEPAQVRVRPKLTIGLRDLRLFDRAAVHGSIRPKQPAGPMVVRLYRNGTRMWERRLRLNDGRFFKTTFRVKRPGRYRATGSFTDEAGTQGFGRTTLRSPPLPSLAQGSSNVFVALLERRLQSLSYYLDGTNSYYSDHTADAVRAFNKVEGRSRVGSVDASTWHALADARRPRARYRTSGFHIEIDQTRQVLFTVSDGRVQRTIHVSTGRDGYTPDGSWRIYRKIAGYSGGGLYYPSYYEGRRALHGWPEVPTYNASHGCTRLPMWTAKWVFGKARIGTLVRIYH